MGKTKDEHAMNSMVAIIACRYTCVHTRESRQFLFYRVFFSFRKAIQGARFQAKRDTPAAHNTPAKRRRAHSTITKNRLTVTPSGTVTVRASGAFPPSSCPLFLGIETTASDSASYAVDDLLRDAFRAETSAIRRRRSSNARLASLLVASS